MEVTRSGRLKLSNLESKDGVQEKEPHMITSSEEAAEESDEKEDDGEEVSNLTWRLREALQELGEVREESRQLAEEVDHLRGELEGSEHVKKELARALQHEQDQRESLHESVRQKIEALELASKSAAVEAHEKLVTLQLENEKLRYTVKLETSRRMKVEQTARSQLTKLKSQLSEASNRIKEELAMKDRYKQSHERLKAKLTMLERHVETLRQSHRKAVKSDAQSISELCSRLEAREVEVHTLKEEIDTLVARFQSSMTSKDEVIAALRAQNEQLQRMVSEKDEIAVSHTSLLRTLDQRLDSLIRRGHHPVIK